MRKINNWMDYSNMIRNEYDKSDLNDISDTYIYKLETRNEKALDYIERLLKGLVEKDAKYDLTAILVTLQVILEKGDEYE